MSNGILFITAKGVDSEKANAILESVYDEEFGSGDRFHIVTQRQADDAIPDNVEITLAGSYDDKNPFSNENNAWAGASIQDVEEFVRKTQETNDRKDPGLFLIVDDQSLEENTIIVMEQDFEHDSEENYVEKTGVFKRLRVPKESTYGMWCNLDIANMSFEEWTDFKGPDADGWYTYRSF